MARALGGAAGGGTEGRRPEERRRAGKGEGTVRRGEVGGRGQGGGEQMGVEGSKWERRGGEGGRESEPNMSGSREAGVRRSTSSASN